MWCGSPSAKFRQYYPHPGHVEHDPYEIWQSQLAVAHAVLADAGVSGTQIRAIGITNQRETTMLWDRKTGEPVGRALVWQDRRTAPMCEALQAEGHGDTFQQKTGLIIDAYFSGTKLRWMLDHYEGARARAERGELAFGTVDRWLIWQLTDGARHVTDVSNASRTLLFNIHDFRWDDELLGLLDIPRSLLPEVAPSQRRGGAHLGPAVRHRDPHRRHRRRPAGGHLRPGLLLARHGEEHLRHRLFHPDECRRAGP